MAIDCIVVAYSYILLACTYTPLHASAYVIILTPGPWTNYGAIYTESTVESLFQSYFCQTMPSTWSPRTSSNAGNERT